MNRQSWMVERNGSTVPVDLVHDVTTHVFDVRVAGESRSFRVARQPDGPMVLQFFVLGAPAEIRVGSAGGDFAYEYSDGTRTPVYEPTPPAVLLALPPAPVAAPAPPVRPVRDASLDTLRAMLVQRAQPASPFKKGALFLGTLLFFIVTWHEDLATRLPMLVGVILFHELGHYCAMLLFGYRDLRIFFIPLVGAAASGKRGGAPAWQEGIVLLAGPVPGLVVGAVLLIATAEHRSGFAFDLGLQLVGLNAMNLIPVVPLDGGRLFQILIFSRHPVAEIIFYGLCGVSLGLMGFGLPSYPLGIFGVLMLLGLGSHWRRVKEAKALQPEAVQWAPDVTALSDEHLRQLDAAAGRALTPQQFGRMALRAQCVEDLHDRSRIQPPSILPTFLLGAAWMATLFFIMATTLVIAVLAAGHQQRIW